MIEEHKKQEQAQRGSPKERLLEAGLDVFGEYGYDAATTRVIASKAGMNVASIPYYFQSKQGLYQAVVELVTTRITTQLEAPLKSMEAALDRGFLTALEALDLIERFLQSVLELMIGSQEAQRFMRIILREQLYPSSAYDILFKRFMEPLFTVLSRLVAVATGSPSSRLSMLRAFSLMGQVMIFRIGRETVVRCLELEGYSSRETEEIRGIVLGQTRAALANLGEGSL